MDVLSGWLTKAGKDGIIKGLKLPNNGPILSHLFYADDAIVVGEWSDDNMLCITRILRCFHLVSGLKVNFHKSNLFGVGVSNDEVVAAASKMGCRPGVFPFCFLGLTVGANMNRVANWNGVKDIVECRISKWKASCLSIGGRITLIKSVIESLPLYYFSLYKAPKSVISYLEKIIKRFLWGGTDEVKKVNWVGWEAVTKPITCGGLGIQKLEEINVSLLSKWLWKYKGPKRGLWMDIIDAIHGKARCWKMFPAVKSIPGVWNNMVKISDVELVEGWCLRHLIRGEVGDGKKLRFWLDPWMSKECNSEKYPNLFRLESKKNCLVADRICYMGGRRRFEWKWKWGSLSASEMEELVELTDQLNQVNLKAGEDRWRWLGNVDGVFSAANVKEIIRSKHEGSNGFVMEWVKWVPIKCNVHMWRAELGRLATMDALVKRNIHVADTRCALCGTGIESADHIFTACEIASIVWQFISRWCKVPPIFAFTVKDLLLIHKYSGLNSQKMEVFQGIIMVACWCLWTARNKKRFEGKEGCFFRQFFTSVAKVDYLTLRHGFINTHLTPESQHNFDFHKYISRSLEEDFKEVVGISPTVWFFAVLLLLTNTHDWYAYLWLPFIPLIIILLVGTKLVVIITQMGRRTHEMADVVKGTPVVQPTDDLFWFGRPRLVLLLINFVLFQNAFQLAFLWWSWDTFGFTCFHHRTEDIVIRITMGVVIQFLCSYVTLPLYALVTQMGSRMKPTVFGDNVAKGLKSWQHNAKRNIKHGHHSSQNTPFSSRPGTPLHGSTSPINLLHRHPEDSLDSPPDSPREGWANESSSNNHLYKYQEPDQPDVEEGEIQEVGSTSTTQPSGRVPVRRTQSEVAMSDFSFGQQGK